jgi:hypothetical protein
VPVFSASHGIVRRKHSSGVPRESVRECLHGIDLKTGRHIRDLAGFGFTPSPNGKWVAHVAPLVHFAPPYAKSYYLQLNDVTVYPLPKNMKPLRQPGFEQSSTLFRRRVIDTPAYTTLFQGLHGRRIRLALPSLIVFSTGSKRVALTPVGIRSERSGTADAPSPWFRSLAATPLSNFRQYLRTRSLTASFPGPTANVSGWKHRDASICFRFPQDEASHYRLLLPGRTAHIWRSLVPE